MRPLVGMFVRDASIWNWKKGVKKKKKGGGGDASWGACGFFFFLETSVEKRRSEKSNTVKSIVGRLNPSSQLEPPDPNSRNLKNGPKLTILKN